MLNALVRASALAPQVLHQRLMAALGGLAFAQIIATSARAADDDLSTDAFSWSPAAGRT